MNSDFRLTTSSVTRNVNDVVLIVFIRNFTPGRDVKYGTEVYFDGNHSLYFTVSRSFLPMRNTKSLQVDSHYLN